LTKKSSAQGFFDVSLTKSLLSTQTLSRFEVRSKEERRERLLGTRRHFSEVGTRENEWVTVRNEEKAIYTRSRNLTVQIYVGTADADLGTSDLN
jgi:hypothetical protein